MTAEQYLSPAERAALAALPVPLCVYRLMEGHYRLIVASAGLRELLRLPAAGADAAEADPTRWVCAEDEEAAVQARAYALLHPEQEYHAVRRLKCYDGSILYVEITGRIRRTPQGAELLYAQYCDVTERETLHSAEKADAARRAVLMDRILETTQTAIFWKDADRRFAGANRAFLDYYGFADESALLGKNDEEMGWHSAPDPYKNDEMRVLHTGASTCRVPGKCFARGENRDIVASKSPLYENGRIVGLVGSFEDVTTECRQREEISRLNAELHRRIAELDMLMESTRVSIARLRLDAALTLEWGNDTLYRTIGMDAEAFRARCGGSVRAYFGGRYETVLAAAEAEGRRAAAAHLPRFDLLLQLPVQDGAIWVSGAGTFAPDGESGRTDVLYAVFKDVTDVVRMQQQLAAAQSAAEQAERLRGDNEMLDRILSNVSTGISACILRDGEFSRVIINRHLADTLHVCPETAGQYTCEQFLSFVHPEDLARVRQNFLAFLQAKAPLNGECRLRVADSEHYLWMHVEGMLARRPDGADVAYLAYTNVGAMKQAEAELRENRRIYEKTVLAARLIMWVYDVPHGCIDMMDNETTKAECAKFGWPMHFENVPESTLEIVDEADLDKFREMFRAVAEGHDASCDVWFRERPGREPRCERVTYTVECGADGKPLRAIGIGQNVTAEKKVEERYERELGNLRQNRDNHLIAKGHYNLTKNIVLEYTTQNDSIYKLEPGRPYDDACRDFVQQACQESERGRLHEAFDRQNLMRRYQQGETQTTLQYRRLMNGREPVWIAMNIHTYTMPETGDVECFTYAYDITEKVQTDEIMGLISEVEFDYIGMIFAAADEFEFLKKSPAIVFPQARQRTKYSACCSYVRSHFVLPEESAQFDAAVSLERILQGLRASGHCTSTYRRTEGGRLLCKQLDYVWLDRESQLILVVRSDVTAAFERDQQQLHAIQAAKLEADRANEAKSTFLSSMSHDLRTPLNGILGFTELALHAPEENVRQDYLRKIQLSGQLLLTLVNDTLELSRIESGKMVLEPAPVRGSELMDAVITSLRPAAEAKDVALAVDDDAFAAENLCTDRLKLQKVILNLVSNAIKYTPAGGHVKLSVTRTAPSGDGCDHRIVVEDTGIGMSEAFLARAFEPFAQEHRPEAANVTGTGLGLAIVKRIVELMNGRIAVESRIGAGTRFTVDLPLPAAPSASAPAGAAPDDAALLRGRRILLCEDNYLNAEIASLLLKDKGVTVDTAKNGREGLDAFARAPANSYDAILMDIRMPVMDGYEAVRAIRALDRPDAAAVPILAMSADAFEEDVRRAREAGMNGYITKPVEPQAMYAAIAACLAHAAAQSLPEGG